MLRNPIQIESRTDQGQVTESLGRVTQLLSTAGNLLREHHQMVGEAEHILKEIDGPGEILGLVYTGPRHCLDQPEGTHAEGTLAATDSWFFC